MCIFCLKFLTFLSVWLIEIKSLTMNILNTKDGYDMSFKFRNIVGVFSANELVRHFTRRFNLIDQ